MPDQIVKRMGRFRAHLHQSSLAEVIEHESGKCHEVPGTADGSGGKMPEIGVERLASRDREEYRRQNRQRMLVLMHQKQRAIHGIQGP
jgi:hypothetical protein